MKITRFRPTLPPTDGIDFRFRALPFVALVLAIAFSAFTMKPAYESQSLQVQHFYEILPDGSLGDYIGDFDPDVAEDWQELKDITGCPDQSGVCARGFTSMNPSNPNSGYLRELKSIN